MAEEQKKPDNVLFSDKEMEEWLFPKDKADREHGSLYAMFYGTDGTGKSGVMQCYPLKKDEKMVILDLDGGNEPLLETYHEDRKEQIIVKNPLEITHDEKGNTVTDYGGTMNRIRSVVEYTRRNLKDKNIRCFCIDGMSKLLKFAEAKMRIDKHIQSDGGVSQAFWKIRAQYFLEIVEMCKSLPIDVIFIAHDDFIEVDDKIARVKQDTNQMVWQKLRFIRDSTKSDRISYKVVVDKNKYNAGTEGAEFEFAKIMKEDRSVKWRGEQVFPLISKKFESNKK